MTDIDYIWIAISCLAIAVFALIYMVNLLAKTVDHIDAEFDELINKLIETAKSIQEKNQNDEQTNNEQSI